MQQDIEEESDGLPSMTCKNAKSTNNLNFNGKRKQLSLTMERILRKLIHPLNDIIDYPIDEQQEAIKIFGFGPILNLKGVEIDEEFFYWLADNLDADKRTLNAYDYSLDMTNNDIECIFGLSNHGKDIKIKK